MAETILPETELTVKPGDVLLFKGCTWDDGWDFDAPLIIYAPVQRYCMVGSICAESIFSEVEDLAIDLCLGPVRREFYADDLKEFDWRGWSPKRFARRRSAIHACFEVTFRGAEDDLEFDIRECQVTQKETRL